MRTKPPIWLFLQVSLLLLPIHADSQENAYYKKSITRAVIFSVSAYHDDLFPSFPESKTDAEHFAAFLRSRSGGLIPADLIQLNTGTDATLANLAALSNWIQEDSRPGDQVILYLSCYARLLKIEDNSTPYIFFADSPYVPAGAGAMTLSSFLHSIQEIGFKNSLSFQLYLNFEISTEDDIDIWKQWLFAFQRSFNKAFFSISDGSEKNNAAQNGNSYGQCLINGLLGEADNDGDEKVTPLEIIKALKKKGKEINKGKIFFTAFSSEFLEISRAQKNILGKTSDYDAFPTMVGLETSSLEDSLLKKENAKTKQWYHDFIITMKLDQFIAPPGRCASDLYDSLSTIPSLSPLYRHWQRKLGAALLDETQQALNAYLKTDTRELMRRWKHATQYDIYPKYMERAIELIGPNSFMTNILQTKLYYFKGLKYRLDGEKNNYSGDLRTALKMQEKAIAFEPEAAFVLNEIGVLYMMLDSIGGDKYFLEALQYAPRWMIPSTNLSIYYQKENMLDEAMEYALESVQNNPENVIALHNLGVMYLRLGNYQQAEKYFMHVIALDIKNEGAYYNLSCTKALQGENSAAVQWLEKAILLGYNDWGKIETDPDLIGILEMDAYIMLKKKYDKD